MHNMPIIEVQNLSVVFDSFKAVDNISFSVKKGETFGFLGANGAGKTTTIRTICGLLNPTSGNIFVYGKDISKDTSSIKDKIGYMSQKSTLYPDLTIWENIEFTGSLYDMKKEMILKRSAEIFDFMGFNADKNTLVKNLSSGVKQSAALSAALLHNPDLIFLDEPTSGASEKTREKFWRLIKLLASEGKTVFITTHYMNEAEFADRIILMKAGKIAAQGAPKELKEFYKKPNLEEVFLEAVSKNVF